MQALVVRSRQQYERILSLIGIAFPKAFDRKMIAAL